MSATTAPYGSWKSPISAEMAASAGVSLGQVFRSGGDVYWLELRPLEGGRLVVVRRAADGTTADMTPPNFNARTRVHEYGGGSYFVHEGRVYFSNFADQRLYRQRPGELPQPITPEPEIAAGLRYADGRVTPDGKWIVCVRERHHPDREATNELAALPPDGSAQPHVIASGRNFYSTPRLSPDGKKLAWLQWDHPNMPWDGTELWAAEFGADGALRGERRVAGGKDESIFQPAWSPEGFLHFISDRSGWWNLYAEVGRKTVALTPMSAEVGVPQWTFGFSRYAFLSGGRIACVWSQDGIDHLGIVLPREDGRRRKGSGAIQPLDLGFTGIYYLVSDGGDRLWFIAGGPTQGPAVVTLEVSTGRVEVLKRSSEITIDPGYLSTPRAVEFPTERGLTAHALFYPPTNRDFSAPPGEKPPLLVMSHGGPTSSARSEMSLSIQYWTSRGIGVVDVNYGGSTGYGRAYWRRLIGQWGIVDVEDCINAAKYLAAQGEADPDRLAIRGGSAGGYTTLCALTFHNVFKAGASYYGIGDMETMVRDTHKFESRYCDMLVAGTYPAPRELLRERSPIHFTKRISAPMILFQGLEDKVVPPNQAEDMVRALRARGLPYAYLAFEGEQHGFRKAETNRRCLEAEAYFYSRIFGFDLADEVEPVKIENL